MVQKSTKYSPKASEQISKLCTNIWSMTTENPDFIMLTESWINTQDKYQILEVSQDV